MNQPSHRQDADATSHGQDTRATDRGTAFQAVEHGQDVRAARPHGHDARATGCRCGHTKNRGFTLAEVLVASTISGFIALVAVSALNAISGSAQRVNQASETTSEIRFAARMIARDLANLYRDPNPQNMKLLGVSQGAETTGPPFLTFYMVGRAKARAEQPEGEIYEVEYFLGSRRDMQENTRAAESADQEGNVLFRRLWPNPDKERDPGGILTPIAENIGVFELRFYDGQQLGGQWTEEMQSLPEFIQITLATVPPEKGDPIVETMMVTFPRLSRTPAGGAPQGEGAEGQQGRQGQQGSSTSSTTESTTDSGGTKSSGPSGQSSSGGGSSR